LGKDKNGNEKKDMPSKNGAAVERQTTSGMVEIVLKDKNGNKVLEKKLSNMIVASGRTLLADLLRGDEESPLTHIAVGTGVTPPDAGDIVLETEFGDRHAFDESNLTEAAVATAILSSGVKDVLQVSAQTPGNQGNALLVSIAEAKEGVEGRFDLIVKSSQANDVEKESAETLETFDNLSSAPDDERYFFNLINRDSKLIRVAHLAEEQLPMTNDLKLEGGCDTHLKFFPKTNNLTLTLTWKIFF